MGFCKGIWFSMLDLTPAPSHNYSSKTSGNDQQSGAVLLLPFMSLDYGTSCVVSMYSSEVWRKKEVAKSKAGGGGE